MTKAIESCLEKVLAKVKETNRKQYAEVWEETVSNEYLILRGLKKVMRSSKYYAFPSTSIMASKKSLLSNN